MGDENTYPVKGYCSNCGGNPYIHIPLGERKTTYDVSKNKCEICHVTGDLSVLPDME